MFNAFLASYIVDLLLSLIKMSLKFVETFNFIICAHNASLATACLLVDFSSNIMSNKFACLRRTESATRTEFRYVSKAVQQALLLLSGNIQSNPGSLAANNNINRNALLPFSIVTVHLVTTLSDRHCFIHALRYSLATNLKCEYLYHDILNRVKNKTTVNEANYTAFFAGTIDSLSSLTRQYFDLRYYSTNFGDLVPLIASKSFLIRIVICSRTNQRIADCSIIQPYALPAADVYRLL